MLVSTKGNSPSGITTRLLFGGIEAGDSFTDGALAVAIEDSGVAVTEAGAGFESCIASEDELLPEGAAVAVAADGSAADGAESAG